jgi:hypothetical protein
MDFLNEKEQKVLTEYCAKLDLSEQAVMRQALRTYQLVTELGLLSGPRLEKLVTEALLETVDPTLLRDRHHVSAEEAERIHNEVNNPGGGQE